MSDLSKNKLITAFEVDSPFFFFTLFIFFSKPANFVDTAKWKYPATSTAAMVAAITYITTTAKAPNISYSESTHKTLIKFST